MEGEVGGLVEWMDGRIDAWTNWWLGGCVDGCRWARLTCRVHCRVVGCAVLGLTCHRVWLCGTSVVGQPPRVAVMVCECMNR
eukprot:306366-Chlamydomonas_euryale.AAC.9